MDDGRQAKNGKTGLCDLRRSLSFSRLTSSARAHTPHTPSACQPFQAVLYASRGMIAVGLAGPTMLLLTYLLEAAGRLRVVASRQRVLATAEVPASLDIVDLFNREKWQSRRNKGGLHVSHRTKRAGVAKQGRRLPPYQPSTSSLLPCVALPLHLPPSGPSASSSVYPLHLRVTPVALRTSKPDAFPSQDTCSYDCSKRWCHEHLIAASPGPSLPLSVPRPTASASSSDNIQNILRTSR